jgi:hypothetical protein
MKKLESEIMIFAEPDKVWSVLTNFSDYPRWNPFIERIEGAVELGARLRVRIHPPSGSPMTFKPRVLNVVPASELGWLGHLLIPGLFDGEHHFQIERVEAKQTLFRQSEVFQGLLVGLLPASLYHKTLAGFDEMNHALKAVCES